MPVMTRNSKRKDIVQGDVLKKQVAMSLRPRPIHPGSLTHVTSNSRTRHRKSIEGTFDNQQDTKTDQGMYQQIDPRHIVTVNNGWKYETVDCNAISTNCATDSVQSNTTCDCDVFKEFEQCEKHQAYAPKPMTSNPKEKSKFKNRGLLIIFNNVNFSKSSRMGTRNGSEMDVIALQDTFTCLGYKVVIKRDSTVNRMLDICMRIAELEMLKEHTALFIAVLSHGEKNDYVYGYNGNGIQIDDLIEPFRGNNCPGLAGKPKIFLVNACRGTQFDDGVGVRLYDKYDKTKQAPQTRSKTSDRSTTDVAEISQNFRNIKIPHTADVLIAYSCVSGYFSWRNQKEGSWFVQHLCKQLQEANYETDDFMRILTRASATVAYEMASSTLDPSMNNMKQVPCIVSTLTKSLFFE